MKPPYAVRPPQVAVPPDVPPGFLEWINGFPNTYNAHVSKPAPVQVKPKPVRTFVYDPIALPEPHTPYYGFFEWVQGFARKYREVQFFAPEPKIVELPELPKVARVFIEESENAVMVG